LQCFSWCTPRISTRPSIIYYIYQR
jgi:hypothetical protein